MMNAFKGFCRAGLLVTSAICGLSGMAMAQDVKADEGKQTVSEVVVTLGRKTRSAVSMSGSEIQKLLPGTNALKAIQTLPGVLFETADPWGNNEQNLTLFVHGFSLQQLGYTMDGVPLGDQQYGNYNGLSPSRAVISENISHVTFSAGTGDLATASTSNLGGTIETFSQNPNRELGVRVQQTLGSYETNRTFLRFDTGMFGGDQKAYISILNHDARAWDFKGHQKAKQANIKYVGQFDKLRLTAFADYSDKVEPNEDSVVHVKGETFAPYTRPFLYPDYNAGMNYLDANGAPPKADGNNFRNYHSAAQRMDALGYVKADYSFSSNLTWSTQAYFHHDEGRGIVAGPINQAGLPALFAIYYPNLTAADMKAKFGGTGYAVRTTEYLINRGGLMSSLKYTLANHELEAGFWWENNYSTTNRVWYPFAASSSDLTPYDVPTNKNFTQYASHINNQVVQLHVQDKWKVNNQLTVQGGFKSSLQFASGTVPIQQKNLPYDPSKPVDAKTNPLPTLLPSGDIDTKEWFLPQLGATYQVTPNDQLFVNVQKNLRQFVTYGAGGLSPWSLGSQQNFDLFKRTAKPETSWTYELGARSNYVLNYGILTGVETQLSVYHVDFSNRQLQISATPVLLSLVSGPAILTNVGNVKTDGVDLATTFKFGRHFSIYNAVSYNKSTYQSDYQSGKDVVPTAGKRVPATPEWMNKTLISATFGDFEGQISGDYVGKRYATYTYDLWVKDYFLVGAQASYKVPVPTNLALKSARISVNVTNLTQQKGTSTLVVGAASNTYNTYPIPPRMVFVTLSAGF